MFTQLLFLQRDLSTAWFSLLDKSVQPCPLFGIQKSILFKLGSFLFGLRAEFSNLSFFNFDLCVRHNASLLRAALKLS